jgi:hypothetical protein
MHVRLKALALAGAAIAAGVAPAAHAGPTAGVHEGAGYAVASGPEGAAACASVATAIPNQVSVSPAGVSQWIATGRGLCEGNLPIATTVTIEAFTPDGTHHLINSCAGNTCSLTVPAGWGTFYVMPSSFWTAPTGSTWIVQNTVNNDGYCSPGSSATDIVCRGWATGVS